MKTNLIVSIFALFIGNGFLAAQEEMKLEWETRLEHRTTAETGFSQEKGISFAATEKEISVIDNNTGKVKWNKTFKTISEEIRKVDEIIPMWDANTLFLFDKKLGKDKVVCVDMETGNMLWWTEKYQNLSEYNVVFVSEMDAFALALKDALVMIKVRSGEEIWQTSKFKGVVGSYIVADGNLIMLNYKPTALGALFAGLKNQLVKIDMKNGDVIWDTDYIGLVERKVISGEPVLSMKLENGKLFLTLNGLQVYDVNSGTRLWSCAYDVNINEVVKAPMGAVKWGVYNAIADPLIVGQDVYIIDMQGKRKQYIKKYDLNSGKLLWTSPELEGVRVAPNLYLSGDKLVLQVGGVVETQAYIVKRTRQPDGSYVVTKEWRRDFPTIKPCRLMGFNATNGAQLWESERFKKGITNALIHDGKVIACSGKAFYSMNIDNGKENYELSLGDDNIGLATKILTYKDNIVVVGEKGVALHSPSDGKFLKSSKYKKSMLDDMSGQYLLMRTEGGDIACFDLETCKHKRFDARKDAQSYLADDGSYVVVFEKKTASRLSTR